MTRAADAVEHDTGELHPRRSVVAEAPHQGRQGAGLTRGLDHEHHRQIELGCHLGRAALAAGTATVKQTHHAFNQGQLGATAMPDKAALHPVGPAQQGVEIAAGATRQAAVQLGVEVVGPHLERLNGLAAARCRGDQHQAQQRFAAAAGGSRDQTGHGQRRRTGSLSGRQQPGSDGHGRCHQRIGGVVAAAEQACQLLLLGGVGDGHHLLEQLHAGHAAGFKAHAPPRL